MERLLTACSDMLDAKQYDNVIKCCDDYLKMKSKSGLGWHLKGLAYQKKDDIEKAEECFRKAAELDPQEPSNYYLLGILLYNKKRFEDALILFQLCYSMRLDVNYAIMMALCNISLNRREDAEANIRLALGSNKKETAKVLQQMFDRFYKNSKDITVTDRDALKMEIEKLTKSK